MASVYPKESEEIIFLLGESRILLFPEALAEKHRVIDILLLAI
jgi:hypothetical protein